MTPSHDRMIATILVTALLASAGPAFETASAREIPPTNPPSKITMMDPTGSPVSLDRRVLPNPRSAAAPDTTVLGSWTFDAGSTCDAQGWTSFEATDEVGDFWHVDDFVGTGGGAFGRLVALEGSQSMWCGARADATDPVLCNYAKLPGYGNGWKQGFRTADCLSVSGNVVVDYLIAWDSEEDFDATWVQYDLCDDNWIDFDGGWGVYDGVGSGFFSSGVPGAAHAGSIRLQFWFVSDNAWSDEDGLNNSDGAVILDSLTVHDAGGVVLATELFETESVGDHTTASGNWTSVVGVGYGHYAGLFLGTDVLQEDPCVSNVSCLWGFFSGSTYNYACGGHAEQAVVPYASDDVYIYNSVQSDWIPIAGAGSQFELHFDVYRDLSTNALVFYNWGIRSLVGGCPKDWQSRDGIGYYGDYDDWYRMRQSVGGLVHPSATDLQILLSVRDLCEYWCGLYGDGSCHSHSPLFDNVQMLRIDSQGPQWMVRDMDLFQDSFAGDGTTTGTVRADVAKDLLPDANPAIHPGDSAIVWVGDPEVGLAADPYTGFGPAVYAYVSVWPQNQSGKHGSALTDDAFRWPVVDSLVYNGDKWYCIRVDSVFGQPPRTNPQQDRFCVDLNDNLFTPGDTVCFVFAAMSGLPVGVTRYYTIFTGPTEDLAYALDNPMEFTCLPTGGRDILYVDDFDGRGAQPYFDTAFEVLGIADRVDRYDVRQPSSVLNNGPGSRVTNVGQQLHASYRTIIWSSGDLEAGLVGDGTASPSKSDDFAMLYAFIHDLPDAGGIYLAGDNIAEEWVTLAGTSASNLRSQYIDFTLANGDHQAAGQPLSPFVVGESGGCLEGDTVIAFGGCPTINDFDVLGAQGLATVDASYSAASGAGAIVAQQTTNAQAAAVGVVLSGFSYHEIRDVEAEGHPARADHLRRILMCLGSAVPAPTNATPTAVNSLAQNYPNPFNPSTTIEFTLRERGRVTLRVHNVAGQLVATLVDGERTPGVSHRVEWDGRNTAGARVASGVYFYRLATKGFTQTKKMVVLK